MNESPFRPKNLGSHQVKIQQLAQGDAESLLDRSRYIAPGRYRSLFETHLETAMMFLNKAIAFDGVTEVPVSATPNLGDDINESLGRKRQSDLFTPTEENDSASERHD